MLRRSIRVARTAQRSYSTQLPPFDHKPQKYTGPSIEHVQKLRTEYLSPALLTYYKKPIMVVEGKMQYVWYNALCYFTNELGMRKELVTLICLEES
jgi:hypothetical protein